MLQQMKSRSLHSLKPHFCCVGFCFCLCWCQCFIVFAAGSASSVFWVTSVCFRLDFDLSFSHVTCETSASILLVAAGNDRSEGEPGRTDRGSR